jgi:hypothetical protein
MLRVGSGSLVTAPQALLAALMLLALAAPGAAKECYGGRSRPAAERGECGARDLKGLKPYDPRDERRAEPGVIDLGNGTTVRVRGSVSMEADVVRR